MKNRIAVSLIALLALGCLTAISPAASGAATMGPKDVYVYDEDGNPVTGGTVTWRMKDGSARSAQSYGLTADGLITFPYAPTGDAYVSIVEGWMASGDYVSGSYSVNLGRDGAKLQLGKAPGHRHKVTVVGPDGGGVAGAVVRLRDSCTVRTWNPEANWVEGDWVSGYYDESSDEWVDGYQEDGHYDGAWEETSGITHVGNSVGTRWGNYQYTGNSTDYDYSYGGWTATTDENGVASIWGYFDKSDCNKVTVAYNDGIVIQTVSGQMESTVELPYVPVVTISASDVNTHLGAAVSIPVDVSLGSNSLRAPGFSHARRVGVSTAVSVVLPGGANVGRCGAKLKATTNSAGKATLKVCATASGLYRLRAKGSMRKGGVMIRVKGAVPMQVTSVTVRSKKLGQASASWNPPLYAGGAAVKKYVITVTKGGSVVKKYSTKPSKRIISVNGLAHTAKYTFTIKAVTRYGTSQAVVRSVTVA